jgi:hypothetical protein
MKSMKFASPPSDGLAPMRHARLAVDERWIRDLEDELAMGYHRFKERAKKGYVHARRIGKRKHLAIWADAE